MNLHKRFGFIAIVVLMMVSINAWAGHLPLNAEIQVTTGEGDDCSTLVAGQNIMDAGTVCYSVDASTLEMTVTYTTYGDWVLTEAHLWAGTNPEGYPQTGKGNPKVGNFPYNSGTISGTSWSFTLQAADYGVTHDDLECDYETSVFAMAHAALERITADGGLQTETGWGSGKRVVDRGSWATQTALTLKVDCSSEPPPPPPSGSETAFGFYADEQINHTIPGNGNSTSTHQDSALSTCFLDIPDDDGAGPNRWGWTNGLIKEGDRVELVMYAGAGQCKLESGTRVGTAVVFYSGGTVSFTMNQEAGNWTEAHIYAGYTPLPVDGNGTPTVAPGQYNLVIEESAGGDDIEGSTYSIAGLSGDIYVIVHAAVTGLQ